jgi:hypothetical protein
MNSPKLKILLSLTILWGCRFAAPAEAAEQNRSFYHPEVKAILNGGKVMLFPSDHRLGTLQYPGAKGRRGKSISATGRVELPDKAEVMLVPSSYLLQNPALINCFGGAISGIELKSEEGTALLQKLAAKKSIKTLRLSGVALDQKLISEINSLSQLTSLQFDHTEASSTAISTNTIKRLQQLEWLAVDASTTTLLKQIAKSNFLKKLEISNANLTLADFAVLQKLPALQFLSIQQSQYPDAAVAYFPRFRTLKTLWLGKRHWTKQSILPLKKMTMLDELHVRMFDQELPLLVELHEALPEVVVN